MGLKLSETLHTATAHATDSLSVVISPPSFAHAAVFYWNISAVAGTSPIADCKLQALDNASGTAIDIDGATFAQQTAASFQALQVRCGLTADTTGNFRAVSALIPAAMKAVFTFDRTTGNETYTFTLSVDWLGV